MFEKQMRSIRITTHRTLDRLLKATFPSYLNHRYAEASKTIGVGVDSDDHQFTRLSSGRKYDVTPMAGISHRRHLEIARWLMRTKSFAWELLQTKKAFLIGEGFQVKARRRKVQKVLDEFMKANRWVFRFPEEAMEAFITGELHIPVQVNPVNGHVRLGYALAEDVANVIPLESNLAVDDRIIIRDRAIGASARELKIIRPDEDPMSETFGLMKGEVFTYRRNMLKNERRGWSDFLQVADWIHLYDHLLFARGQKQSQMNNYFWNLQVKATGHDELRARALEEERKGPPEIGEIRVSAIGDEEWKPVAPNLNAKDNLMDLEEIKGHGVAGVNQALEWHGLGRDVNKATSRMTYPVFVRALEMDQTWLVAVQREMFEFVIDQAVAAGQLGKDIDKTVDITSPDLNILALETFGKIMDRTMDGLKKAVDYEFSSQKSARATASIFFRQLGQVMDAEDERLQIEKEKKDKGKPPVINVPKNVIGMPPKKKVMNDV